VIVVDAKAKRNNQVMKEPYDPITITVGIPMVMLWNFSVEFMRREQSAHSSREANTRDGGYFPLH
jgi:hypothetical protein